MSRHLGSKLSEQHKIKIGLGNKGKIHSEEFRKMRRILTLGKKQSNETIQRRVKSLKGKKRSLESRLKQSQRIKIKVAEGTWHTGNGSLTPERRRDYNSFEWKIWRESVFKRDAYTCQECKVTGGQLQAHHIKPYSIFPKIKFDLNNGLTLCKKCHYRTDSYGYKAKKLKLLEEYQKL